MDDLHSIRRKQKDHHLRFVLPLGAMMLILLLVRVPSPACAQPENVVVIEKSFYYPRYSARLNDIMLFDARDKTTKTPQLWRTDGTPEGTVKIRDFPEGVYNMQTAGNRVFINFGNNALWKSDGTEPGTVLVTPQIFGKYTKDWTSAGDHLIFVGDDGVHGDELWGSDGTPEGTVMLFEYYPGIQGTSFEFGPEIKGHRFVCPNDGTHFCTTINYYSMPYAYASVEEKIIFFTYDAQGSVSIWISDGTQENTFILISGFRIVVVPIASAGRFYFQTRMAENAPVEAWTSNGTIAGTRRITTLFPEWPPEGRYIQYIMEALGGRIPMIGAASGTVEQNGTLFIFDSTHWNAARHWQQFE